jgi:hypothetical protein
MMEKVNQAIEGLMPTVSPKIFAKFPKLTGQVRVLAAEPGLVEQTWSARRINSLSAGMKGISCYLEIGVQHGSTFEGIRVPSRVAVDPYPKFHPSKLPLGVQLHSCTSDEYFRKLDPEKKFDLIFLDGLHEWFQTYRDLINSLNHLAKGGVILIDDVLPVDSISANPSQVESYKLRAAAGSSDRRWHGDVFKMLHALHDYHPELMFRVILDTDGNSQAVVWVRNIDMHTKNFQTLATPNDYSTLTFDSAFPDGSVPYFFLPGSEQEVILDAIFASQAARH